MSKTTMQPDGVRVTGSPPGMLQDDSRELTAWLAGKPDAMLHARDAAVKIRADHMEDVLVMVPCSECRQHGWHKMSCGQRTDRALRLQATCDAGGMFTVCQRPCQCGPEGCSDSGCSGRRA